MRIYEIRPSCWYCGSYDNLKKDIFLSYREPCSQGNNTAITFIYNCCKKHQRCTVFLPWKKINLAQYKKYLQKYLMHELNKIKIPDTCEEYTIKSIKKYFNEQTIKDIIK